MSVLIKICGINDPAALAAAAQTGADWIGFVFFPPSPRSITPAQATALAAQAPDGLPRAGLFVDPSEDVIAATLAAVRLDALQLYGTDLPIARLRARFGLPVWRAVGVGSRADLPATAAGADRLVIEAKPPEGATRPGGNAASFDWSILAGWKPPAPWVLAGGLTPDNVAAAIAATGAPMVDVSSGVESQPGRKDPALIRDFVANARRAASG
jgi:phosphoribosylanthranilate isomerase